MSKFLLELDTDNAEDMAFFESKQGGSKPAKGKGKAKAEPEPEEDDEEGDEITGDDVKQLCEEYKKANSAKDLKELLAEFDVKTPAAAAKSEDLEDIYEALSEALGEDEEEADDDEEEVDVDTVKKAIQKFTKDNGKEDMAEIFEDFGIKGVKDLKKLDEDELQELYEEVSE